MRLRSLSLLSLALTVAASTVLAQNAPPAAPPQRPARERLRQPEAGPPMMDVNKVMDRLNKDLQLTPDQQPKVRTILETHQQKMREYWSARHELMRKNRQQIQETGKELRAAREAGDQTKVQELQAKMNELTGGKEPPPGRQQMVKDIEGVLTPDQVKTFKKIEPEVFGGPNFERMLAESPGALKQAVASLNLPAERQQKIDALFADAKAKADAVKEPKDRRTISNDLYKNVMDTLTPEEQAKVKEWRPTGPGGFGGSRPAPGERRRGPGGQGQHRRGGGQAAPAQPQQ